MSEPTTEAGKRLLAAPHIVEFTRTGYGLQHPIACRPDLIGCPLNRWLARQTRPAKNAGRYLMSGPGQFEPIPDDWTDPLVPGVVPVIEAEARRAVLTTLRERVEELVPLQYPPMKGAAVRSWLDRSAVLAEIDRLMSGDKPEEEAS